VGADAVKLVLHKLSGLCDGFASLNNHHTLHLHHSLSDPFTPMLTIHAPTLRVPGLAKNLPRICFYGARAASNSVGAAPKKATLASNATSAAKNPPMAPPTNQQPEDVNARWWYQLEEKWYRRSREQSRELNREIR